MSFRVNTNLMAMNTLRNLGSTNKSFSDSVTKLSTGLRINSGADDPAGLQISEGFRAQISGMTQALKNNQDALNFSKTAEGALNEVSQLLRDARSLIIANSNDATLSTTQKQANQNQLNSILNSIDRISNQTQFGQKRLLDGSSGVTASIIDKDKLASVQLGGTLGTQSITASGTLTLTTVGTASQATVTGMAVATPANPIGVDGKLAVNGVNFAVSSATTWNDLVAQINNRSADTGVRAAITGGNLVFTALKYGTSGNSIQITNDTANLGFAAVGTRNLAGGTNLTSLTATYPGLNATTFTADASDNSLWRDAAGNTVRLTEKQLLAAGAATVAVTAGSAQFQIGSNLGQTVNLSLGNTSAASLNLTNLDIMTSAGSATALAGLDAAIETISSQRGNIGSFMRNVLESNVRSLSVAKENITATESSIRDTDVAEEMTMYTKLQILQQSGLAVLAQANQAPQAVLSLLRG